MDQSIYYNKIDPVMHDIPGNVLRNHLYKLFVWFFCVILVVLVCFDWVEYYLNITLVAKPAIRAFLLSIFLFVIIVPVPIIRGLRLPIAFPLIALGYLFFTYALFEENIASGLYYSIRIIFWIAGTFFVYRMLLIGHLSQDHINKVIYVVVFIYSVMILFFMFNPNIRFTQNLSIYVLTWCVPFLMIAKNTFFNKFLIGFAYLSIFLSFKRGAMLALVLSTFVYMILYLWINRSFKASIKIVILFSSLFLLFTLALAVVYETRPDYYERRVSDIFDEDQAFGSGRADFYPLLLKNYFSSFHTSPKDFFLGFGSRSVEKILTGGIYAHSDWLQILYSYGLLGLFIFLWLHVSIIILIWRGIKQRFVFAPALAMNYVIFFLLNIYSGMLFFPNSIYFGMFISLYYYSLLKNNKQFINTRNA